MQATGLEQSELMKLYDRLQYEISRFVLPEQWRQQADPMDEYLAARGMK